MKSRRHRTKNCYGTKNRYGDDWLAFVLVIAGAVLALLVAGTQL